MSWLTVSCFINASGSSDSSLGSIRVYSPSEARSLHKDLIDLHDLFHGQPLLVLWRARQTDLAGIGQWPPLVADGRVFRYQRKICFRVGTGIFEKTKEVALASQFCHENVVVANMGLGDGGSDLGPDIGMELAVFFLHARFDLDHRAVILHRSLRGLGWSGVSGAVDGRDLRHPISVLSASLIHKIKSWPAQPAAAFRER